MARASGNNDLLYSVFREALWCGENLQVFKEERFRGKILFLFYVFAGIFMNSLGVFKTFNAVFQYTDLYIF